MCECVCIHIFFPLCHLPQVHLQDVHWYFISKERFCVSTLLVCWLGQNVEIQTISLLFFNHFYGHLGLTPSYTYILHTHPLSRKFYLLPPWNVPTHTHLHSACMWHRYSMCTAENRLLRFSGMCSSPCSSLHSHFQRAVNWFQAGQKVFSMCEKGMFVAKNFRSLRNWRGRGVGGKYIYVLIKTVFKWIFLIRLEICESQICAITLTSAHSEWLERANKDKIDWALQITLRNTK